MSKPLTLLVEDTPTHRRILSSFLEREGFIVYAVDSCTTALKFLTQFKPDILITNLHLPEMTGIELIQRVRGVKHLTDIPIVAINNSRDIPRTDALKAGATAILRKPIDLAQLMKTLIKACGDRLEKEPDLELESVG
ncbi:MAG TPA: response regulator [Blastocatellia bacterium]|nr:response regulator [Blastocatellia bacterium]